MTWLCHFNAAFLFGTMSNDAFIAMPSNCEVIGVDMNIIWKCEVNNNNKKKGKHLWSLMLAGGTSQHPYDIAFKC